MEHYRQRLVDKLLPRVLAELPAVLMIGPRATGKTTTARRYAKTVVRLDTDAEAAAFRADPDSALAGLAEPVLLDEWQYVPGVLGAVKRAVDAENRPGRFILTGSVRDVGTWPGTGRLIWLDIHPLTVSELLGTTTRPLLERLADGEPLEAAEDTPDLRGYIDLSLRSGFPEVAIDTPEPMRRRWLRSYVRQIIERDALEIDAGRDPARLGNFFEAYALNSAGLATDRTIHTAAGINRETALAYHKLLTSLRVIDELPAWRSNRLARLVKSPKRYLADAALLAAVTGATTSTVIADGDLLGRTIETFVVAQLRAEAAVSEFYPRLHHLRDSQGRHEVDIVAELDGRRIVAVEVKATAAPGPEHARQLRWLREQLGDRFTAGVVLHTGPRTFNLGERLIAAPISSLWA